MKIRRLELQAFGPYVERTAIDFSAYRRAGLMLIHGPTGAGKTTLLDAICWAMFGRSSGSERQGEELRSQQAPPELAMAVALEFDLQGYGYRLERVGRFRRRGLRSADTWVEEEPDAVLRRRALSSPGGSSRGPSGDDALVASGIARVDKATRELLGFSDAQFRQVVMLPQGRFRELLVANSSDRAKIFEAMFRTEEYAGLAAALVERSAAQDARARAARTRMQTLLHGAEVDVPEAITHAAAVVQAELSAGEQEIERLVGSIADLERQRARAQERRRVEEELAEALGQRQALASRQLHIDGVRERVRRAMDWTALLVAREQLQQGLARLDASTISTIASDTRAEAAEAAVVAARAICDALAEAAEERQDWVRELASIDHRLEQARNLARARADAARLERSRASLAEHIRAIETRAERLQQQIHELERSIEASHRSAAELERQRAGVDHLATLSDRADAVMGDVEALERFIRLHHDAHADEVDAHAAYQTAQARVAELERAWSEHAAAQLAETLSSGEPCPVCGSTDHPARARGSAPQPSDAIAQQRSSADEATSAWGAARAATARSLAQTQACVTRISRDTTLWLEDAAALGGELAESTGDGLAALADATMSLVSAATASQVAPVEDAAALAAMWKRIRAALNDVRDTRAHALRVLEQRAAAIATQEGAREEHVRALAALSGKDGDPSPLGGNGGSTTVDLQALITSAERPQGDLRALRVLAAAVDAHLVERRATADALRETLGDTATDASGIEERAAHVRDAIQSRDVAIEAARADLQAAEVERARADADMQREHKMRHALANEVQVLLGEWEEHFDGLGQPSDAEIDQAIEDRAGLAALTAELEAHASARGAVEGRIERARATLVQLDASPATADKAAIDVALAGARVRHAELTEARGRLEERRRALADIGVRLQEALAEAEAEEALASQLGPIARAAKGSNAQGVDLQRWILGEVLDEVVASATLRLGRMTGGRFALQRTGEARRRGAAAGLDLEIHDAHTGTSRPARSLSGGESFLAALALSLALSDVVTSRAGGVELETLFVDEGFGSLDAESLDRAIDVLTELDAGGRLIAIISHVRELEQRIPARLRVIPSERGSRLESTVAGAVGLRPLDR